MSKQLCPSGTETKGCDSPRRMDRVAGRRAQATGDIMVRDQHRLRIFGGTSDSGRQVPAGLAEGRRRKRAYYSCMGEAYYRHPWEGVSAASRPYSTGLRGVRLASVASLPAYLRRILLPPGWDGANYPPREFRGGLLSVRREGPPYVSPSRKSSCTTHLGQVVGLFPSRGTKSRAATGSRAAAVRPRKCGCGGCGKGGWGGGVSSRVESDGRGYSPCHG